MVPPIIGSSPLPRAPREGDGSAARRDGWIRSGALQPVKSPPRSGWTARGYFERLRQERSIRTSVHLSFWYYPYDYSYYCWRRYHYDPWQVWPYYMGYAYPTYYYYAPLVVIVKEPDDWVYGETYVPYVSWPSESLMQAKRDIEQAWRKERVELLDIHLDPEHSIASYLRDEYTHSLTPDEFRQATLDAFSGIRTANFDITSVRYVSTSDWARLKGKHIFYDPYNQRTVVYLSYLLRRVDYEDGYSRWVIWEVRQSPNPD